MCMGFPSGSVVKNSPANAGDVGSIPGLGISLEEEVATHVSILAWETSWTKETGGLQSMVLQGKTWLSDSTETTVSYVLL